MPLRDYSCIGCKNTFETLVSKDEEARAIECPKCHGTETQRLLSRFAIAGRGDLRESTFHGCHGPYAGDTGGHIHSSGCGHGSKPSGTSGDAS